MSKHALTILKSVWIWKSPTLHRAWALVSVIALLVGCSSGVGDTSPLQNDSFYSSSEMDTDDTETWTELLVTLLAATIGVATTPSSPGPTSGSRAFSSQRSSYNARHCADLNRLAQECKRRYNTSGDPAHAACYSNYMGTYKALGC